MNKYCVETDLKQLLELAGSEHGGKIEWSADTYRHTGGVKGQTERFLLLLTNNIATVCIPIAAVLCYNKSIAMSNGGFIFDGNEEC